MGWDEIAQILVVPFVAWCFWVTLQLRTAKRAHDELIRGHWVRDVIEDNSRAIRELSHFVQWMTHAHTGQVPPPYVEPPG